MSAQSRLASRNVTAGGTRASKVDTAIARVAARQHGVVSRAQLVAAGLGTGAIAHRARSGRLHRLHRGVYAVGYVPSNPYATGMAALLACGPGAALSHRSAGALWEIVDAPPLPVDITAPTAHRRRGVVVHRSQTLQSRETRRRFGMAVTSPARTLVDLADVLNDRALARAVNEAQLRRLVTPVDLASALAHAPGRAAMTRLRAFVEQGDAPTRSVLEDEFLAFVERHGLPRPEVNQRVAGLEVDMLWREQGLVVELDGRASHDRSQTFEDDRERDAELLAAAFRVMRITWRRLRENPDREAVRLAQVLDD